MTTDTESFNRLLREWITDARTCTMELIADLSDRELRVAQMAIVNPLDWEVGHVACFQERFTLRDIDGRASLLADADQLFDSIAIEHDVRWDLPLPSRQGLLGYLRGVREATLAAASQPLSDEARYRQMLAVFHEDMHDEAIAYTRQTMGFGAPRLSLPTGEGDVGRGPLPGDAHVPGGRFVLGATREQGFVLDNEQWAHEVEVAPFAIARAPVTQAELAAFVDEGGYRRRELWSEDGWRWREQEDTQAPLYWQRGPTAGWQRRDFDRWVDLEPHRPALHVCWYEADAYCRWARRRLPSELEWEVAAAGEPGQQGRLARVKRFYPWGDEPPSPDRANMDYRAMGTVDVAALPAGDSAFGCRQMLGNVWEWTDDTFGPYPGFEPGPYKEYSEPLFGSTKVLRGGCWVTRSRLIRNTWRNYYEPHRRDVWAGFRTSALDA